MATGVLGLIAAGGGIVRFASQLSTPEVVNLVDALLVALAAGWVVRSAIHGCVGYFLPTPRLGAPRYRLMAISIFNAAFAVGWLSGSILLLEDPDPQCTLGAIVAVSLLAFVLSLATLSAAREAGRERGSEWIRDHLRDPLEPGGNTPLGWILITVIDRRSSARRLSTFVAGTLALLLALMALVTPAAIQSDPAKVSPTPTGGRPGRGPEQQLCRGTAIGHGAYGAACEAPLSIPAPQTKVRGSSKAPRRFDSSNQ